MWVKTIERGHGALAIVALALAAVVICDAPPYSRAFADTPGFKSTEEMIPMRDGVRLHTLICSPEGLQGKLPILLLRTPYGIDGRPASLQPASESWPTTGISSFSRTSAGNSSRKGRS